MQPFFLYFNSAYFSLKFYPYTKPFILRIEHYIYSRILFLQSE
jgi:hypothetical protein